MHMFVSMCIYAPYFNANPYMYVHTQKCVSVYGLCTLAT